MPWYFFAFISALMSATAAILEKRSLFNINALAFSWWLSLFNLLLSFPFIGFVNFSVIQSKALLVLYMKSVLGAFSFLFVMKALKELAISSSLPLLVLTPAFVAIAAFLFLDEHLSSIEILALGLLLIGTYALQTGSIEGMKKPFTVLLKNRAYLFVLAALLIFTLTSLVDKFLVSDLKLKPEAFILLQHLFLFFNFSIMLLAVGKRVINMKINKHQIGLIVLVSIVTILYRYTQIWAIKLGSVALVLAIKRTSVFYAAIIGGKLFNEKSLLFKSVCILLMLGGAIIIIIF